MIDLAIRARNAWHLAQGIEHYVSWHALNGVDKLSWISVSSTVQSLVLVPVQQALESPVIETKQPISLNERSQIINETIEQCAEVCGLYLNQCYPCDFIAAKIRSLKEVTNAA